MPTDSVNRSDCTLISYLRALIGLLENRTVTRAESVAFIHEVRQQSIDDTDFYRYINHKETDNPP